MGVVVFEAHFCANGNHGNQTGSAVMKGIDCRKYCSSLVGAGAIVTFWQGAQFDVTHGVIVKNPS